MKRRTLLFLVLVLLFTAGCDIPAAWDRPTAPETEQADHSATDQEEPGSNNSPETGAGDLSAGDMPGSGMLLSDLDTIAARLGAALGPENSAADLATADGELLAVQLLAAIPEVAGWLANFPDWEGNAWEEGEDGRLYTVDLYSAAADEWLGWGQVDVVNREVLDYFVPRELTADEFQTGREIVETFALNEPELIARLGDPVQWEYETWYNRWEGRWEIWFWYGLEELSVVIDFWEEEPYLEGIYDQNALEAAEAAEMAQNEAISLAWEAEGIDQALVGVDNWQTYVSPQGDDIYAVTFAAADQELFFALVDIAAWQILESD